MKRHIVLTTVLLTLLVLFWNDLKWRFDNYVLFPFLHDIKYYPVEQLDEVYSYRDFISNDCYKSKTLLDLPLNSNAIFMTYTDFTGSMLLFQITPEETILWRFTHLLNGNYGCISIHNDKSNNAFDFLASLSLNTKRSLRTDFNHTVQMPFISIYAYENQESNYFSYRAYDLGSEYAEYNEISMFIFRYLKKHQIYDQIKSYDQNKNLDSFPYFYITNEDITYRGMSKTIPKNDSF